MVTRPVQATVAAACLVLIATANSAFAQSDYLAPIPVPAGSACGDTASDCAAICNTTRDSAGACQSSSRIGDYLRLNLLQQYPVCSVPADHYPLCRANCKSTCGLCGSPSTTPSIFTPASAPSPSQRAQLPLAYGLRSGTLSPSPCTFSCVDIPPPDSPFTCAEQESFGKCNATFMVTPTRGLPQGYCQITCGRCFRTPSCSSRPAAPIHVASIVTGMMIPIASSPTPTEASPLSPLPATSASAGPTAVASPQISGVPVQSTSASSSPAIPAPTPADTSRSTDTLGVPDVPLAPGTPLQVASTTGGSPAKPSLTPSSQSPQASSTLSPLTASSTLPPSLQPASAPAPADTIIATGPASSSSAVGQNVAAGSAASPPSSSVPGSAAETRFVPLPTMSPSLFGSPIAYGSGSSPVQAYVQVPGVSPVQSVVPLSANAETATPDASLQSLVNTLSLAPASQLLLGQIPASPAQPAAVSTVPTSSAGTPAMATGTPGTSAAVCFDIPPPQSPYTCAEQRDLKNCDAPFMVAATPEASSGYCQITCNRCSIPGSAGTTTSLTAAPPATSQQSSLNLLNYSNETFSPALGPALPSPSPSPSFSPSPSPSPPSGASDVLPQAPQTALRLSMTSPSSPNSPGSGTSPSAMGSPGSIDATSVPSAPVDAVNSVPASPGPVLPLPGTSGSNNAAAPPDSRVLSSVPTPGTPTATAVNSGKSAGALSSPAECADLQSDCKLICQQMNNDCSKPGGVGDYLRANCKQSCNLCPTTSPAIGCTKYTWVTGQWGVCNSTCSIGFHNRSVSCLSYGPSLSLQSEADPALCNEAVKPENITTCITSPCAADSAACAVTAAPAASGRRL